MCKYIIITPIKNEEAYIKKTIQSIKDQTLQPYKWIIVNDDSTDKTRDIIEEQMKTYDRIILVNRTLNDKNRKRGKRIVEAFYDGFERIKNEDFEYIVKLDGDLILPPHYFEKIIGKFDMEPKLGISSGISFVQKNRKWVPEKIAESDTFGASKVYRAQCFKEIGGLFPGMGWDGIDHIKAIMKGWNASNIPDLIFFHLRPMGSVSSKVRAAYEEGIGCYIMGYHPIFFILRTIKRIEKYTIIGGLSMFIGYLKSLFLREKRIDDPNFITFLRKNQLKRMRLKRN